MSGEKIIQAKQYEQTCPGAQSNFFSFQFSNFLWTKIASFPKKRHFLPLNGRKDCQYFAQSCPRGCQRLTRKISVCLTKMADALLKVWDNFMGLRRLYASFTHFAEVMRRRKHQKSPQIIKNTKRHQKSPAIPTNQLTCTNMIVGHILHLLWGLQRRKVLKSISHCNKEIFISPGNSSGLVHS